MAEQRIIKFNCQAAKHNLNMSSKKEYNQFQLFVLSFLTAEEQGQVENKLAFGKAIDHSLPLKFRYATSVSELSLKIPPTFIPDQKSGQDILNIVRKYIDELKETPNTAIMNRQVI